MVGMGERNKRRPVYFVHKIVDADIRIGADFIRTRWDVQGKVSRSIALNLRSCVASRRFTHLPTWVVFQSERDA